VKIFQIPHHGSHHNISPAILNKIKCSYALVSCAKDAPKHPSKKVINALIRRNENAYATNGCLINYHVNCNIRSGLYPIAPLSFNNQVEE
jgi:hypothetical protein